MNIKMAMAPLLAAALLASAATPAFGQAALTGPSTVISPQVGGANCKTTAGSPCPNTYQFAPSAGTTNTTVTESPTTYAFSDTFNQPSSTPTFSDFGSAVYSTTNCATNPNCLSSNPLLTWNFQDNYDFTTPSSGPQVQGAVLSFTIPNYGVGLGNVQARIVAWAPGQSAAQLVSTTQVTIVDGWQSVKSGGGGVNLYTATLNKTALAANTEYVLQIRGEALAAAASYVGAVTFTPVPLPSGIVLLISGLVGMAVFRFRKTWTRQWPGASMTFRGRLLIADCA